DDQCRRNKVWFRTYSIASFLELDLLGLLCSVSVLSTLVAVQAGEGLCTDGVGRDHALDGVGHGQVAVLGHQLLVLDLLQAADVGRVGDVELLLGLLAGQDSFVAVDDDHKVAAVDVGGEVDLLLAAQQNSSLGSDAAQRLAGSVEQVPLALDFSGLYESSAHIYILLISIRNSSGAGWGASDSIYHQKPPVNMIFRFFRRNFSILAKSRVFS